MSKSKKKCWSQSVGVYGSRVRVAELSPGGTLYLLWVDGGRKQQKRSLRHRDRKRGKDEALALASRLTTDRDSVEAVRLTIRSLFDNYEEHGLHGRTETHCREVRRKLALWTVFLGADRQVETLNPADVDRFVAARRAGELRRAGKKEASEIGMTTIWHDYVALSTALNFATRHRDARGKPLLAVNPLHGVRVAKTVNPSQPVAEVSYYEQLHEVAARLNPAFGLALDLAHATGHRIDAILKLRWEDVALAASPSAPHGSIRWRGEHDKIENDHVVPMSELAHDALVRASRERPGIGAAWISPSDTDPARPVDRHLASRWLRRAEKLAKVQHVRGRGWHSFRRGWASARKHIPDVDVAAAGGWKDTSTMKRCYQHADAEGVLRAVVIGH
jgi:integrase